MPGLEQPPQLRLRYPYPIITGHKEQKQEFRGYSGEI